MKILVIFQQFLWLLSFTKTSLAYSGSYLSSLASKSDGSSTWSETSVGTSSQVLSPSTRTTTVTQHSSQSNMFLSSYSLNLEAADKIANAAIEAVNNLAKPAPVTVTVLDNGGNVIVQKRMDGCPPGAYTKFSYAKAKTCIHLTCSSRDFRTKYTASNEAPRFTQAASMVSLMEGDLIPVAGGVLIKNAEDGSIVGAIGVSGAAADEDEYLGIIGVANGQGSENLLTTVPPEHCCTTLK